MQKLRYDFLKTAAIIGLVLFATAFSLPTRLAFAVEKTESPKDFPLNHQQILKHLRTANEVAKEAAEFGHLPFGTVLVAPDGEKVLMKQGNVDVIAHAETELSRRAFAAYNPEYLWKCTLVTTIEPCAMCSGNIYWSNIGNMVYGVEEIKIQKLTGASKENPTMNLPCRTVFKAGQKPIRAVGPVPEMEDEIFETFKSFWK